jgi:hypothetical protein
MAEHAGWPTSEPMPPGVRYACGLLWLQGLIWGGLASLLILGIVAAATQVPADRHAAFALVAEAVMCGLASCFAVGTIVLARFVARRDEGARKAAIGVEIAMACLGGIGRPARHSLSVLSRTLVSSRRPSARGCRWPRPCACGAASPGPNSPAGHATRLRRTCHPHRPPRPPASSRYMPVSIHCSGQNRLAGW